ncbi:MAG: hypothetical protein LBB93_02910, partial [Elusimicrobiota bacterium]|nr:hypothetical protein [Elusimicrobiota bacterium]
MSLLKKYQIELAVFFVLMVELAVKIPVMDLSHPDISFHILHYLADYKIAFVGRSLEGTLVHLFSGDFLTAKFVWFFIFVHIILLSLLVSWACGRIIKNADEKYKPFAAYAVIFYLASPVSPAYLFYIGNYGRPDLYMAICLILIVSLLKPLPKPAVRISRIVFIPILCFCLIAFHVYGLAFYFPTIFLILAYNLY